MTRAGSAARAATERARRRAGAAVRGGARLQRNCESDQQHLLVGESTETHNIVSDVSSKDDAFAPSCVRRQRPPVMRSCCNFSCVAAFMCHLLAVPSLAVWDAHHPAILARASIIRDACIVPSVWLCACCATASGHALWVEVFVPLLLLIIRVARLRLRLRPVSARQRCREVSPQENRRRRHCAQRIQSNARRM